MTTAAPPPRVAAAVEIFTRIGLGQWFRYLVGALERSAASGCW